MEEVEEEESPLVARARAGDRNEFDRLVERHNALVRSLAALYVGAGDAADAAQETWLAAYGKLWQLHQDKSFVPWLRTLTFYSCVNYRKARARRRQREVQLDPRDWVRLAECVADGSGDSLASALERAEFRRYVSVTLDGLPEGYGLVLRLRFLRGLSYAEIAAAAHLPLSTVRWRLHEGKRLLRARFAAAVRKGRPGDEHSG